MTLERFDMVWRFLAGLTCLWLSGCSSVSYYSQLASGQWQLLQARQPVATSPVAVLCTR